MSDVEGRIDGLRAFVERLVERLGGHPGVVRLQAVMASYDLAGGGLVAGGLAYTSLLAILPGLLLGLSIVGYLIGDPAVQEQIVAWIAEALPPLKDLATVALEQVSRGAVPTGIIAFVTLLWGSSRFYANIDTAFSRIFRDAPRRNPVAQSIRGILLTLALVLVPVGLVLLGSILSSLTALAPDTASLSALLQVVLQLASPIGSLFAFGVAVALTYRYVPSEHVSWRALAVPAGASGLVLAVLTQLYAFIAPRLVGVATVYGTFVAMFALLAWLSIAFNVLLLGAAWTDVRMEMGPYVRWPSGDGDEGGTEARVRADAVPVRAADAAPDGGDREAGA